MSETKGMAEMRDLNHTYPRVLHAFSSGERTICFADGCRVRTGLDGVTIRADESVFEPYPTDGINRHDFWAHWPQHEACGEVMHVGYGPETYGHTDVIVVGL